MIVIGFANDHAGYEMKVYLLERLRARGYLVVDYGSASSERCDYPDFAHPLAEAVEAGTCTVGISICGSGNGISMTVNKHAGIRGALCWCTEIARLARQHNDANICALPARFITKDEAADIVDAFLNTDFEGGRHVQRINKIPIKH